ncbi:MAG: hypothetical protein K0Q79_855 [Flavipsychrobacter sp.]|jgi:uncharacterized protein YdeI (YjbR/CyaY-like superfamily)|nr:hypothetical protein [Flavipsychrobacter sp.]
MANGIDKTNRYYAKDRKAWRKWLEKNHASSIGVWLVYYKKDSGKSRVEYAEAVEEALCFGWIDSTFNPIDEVSFMQLFTPRKPKSGWSKLNKERIERMVEEGLMMPAGIEKIEAAKKNGTWEKLDTIESFTVPPELKKAFAANKKAAKFFETLGKTNKKYILYYVNGVKSAEKKAKRIEEIIIAANEGRMADRFVVRKKTA